MSAYTTLNITRSKAREAILKDFLRDLSDDILEAHLDRILEDRLYNACVVDDEDEHNDDAILDLSFD